MSHGFNYEVARALRDLDRVSQKKNSNSKELSLIL